MTRLIPFKANVWPLSKHMATLPSASGAQECLRRGSSGLSTQASIAAGQDEKSVLDGLKPLLFESGGRWSMALSGKGVEADFQFRSFNQAWVRPAFFSVFFFFSLFDDRRRTVELVS